MQTQHTPGPWYVHQSHPGAIRHIVPTKSPTVHTVQICTANGFGARDDGETEANFRLMAAAPDLMAELDRCQRMLISIACQPSDTLTEEQKLAMQRQAVAACAVLRRICK